MSAMVHVIRKQKKSILAYFPSRTQISSLQKWFQNFGSNFFDQSERTKLKIQWEMHL
jgi:hypothetical protein